MPPRLISLLLAVAVGALEGLSQNPPAPDTALQQHLGLAQQYLQQKRPDLAIPELEAAIAIDPSNPETQANLGVLYYFAHNYAKKFAHDSRLRANHAKTAQNRYFLLKPQH